MELQAQLSSDIRDMQKSYRVDGNQRLQVVSKLFDLYSARGYLLLVAYDSRNTMDEQA